MDAATLVMARVQGDRRYSRRNSTGTKQLFGMLPGPVCAGRPTKVGAFSGLTGVTFQATYTMCTDAPQIRLAWPLFGLPGSANATPEQMAGPLTVKACVIWGYNNGSGGTYVPVTFNGVRSPTTILGQTLLTSDPVDVPVTQGAGSYFVVRTYVTQAPRTVIDGGTTSGNATLTSATAAFTPADVNATVSGSGIPANTQISAVLSSTAVSMTANATATATGVSVTVTPRYLPITGVPVTGYNPSGFSEGYLSGDFTDSAGNSWGGATNDGSSGCRPIVCGWGSSGLNTSTLIVGDSIAAGSNWSVESSSYSFAGWALDQGSIGGLNLAHSGEQVTTVLASYANQRARLSLAYGFSNVIDEYGVNDLYAAGRTAAQVKADLLTWWSYLAAKGCAVWRTTLLPVTDSTDSWRTVSGQSARNSTYEPRRQALNQWLRAPRTAGSGNSALYDAGGNLSGVFDTTLALEVNSDGTAITVNASTGAISNGSGGYWLTDSTVYASGTVTSIPSSSRLQDTSKSWTTSQWVDYSMVIVTDSVTPAAVGQVRVIAANTTNTLTTDTAWSTTPSTSATYRILKVHTADGTHPGTFAHKLAAAKITTSSLSAA